MKNFKLNKRNAGVASAASKACAWILSIMLVVTGLAPSFAANAKVGKGSTTVATKAATKAEAATKDKATSKTKATNKPDAAKKNVSSSSKNKKAPKDKDEESTQRQVQDDEGRKRL